MGFFRDLVRRFLGGAETEPSPSATQSPSSPTPTSSPEPSTPTAPSARSLDLEPTEFLPASRDEGMATGQGGLRWPSSRPTRPDPSGRGPEDPVDRPGDGGPRVPHARGARPDPRGRRRDGPGRAGLEGAKIEAAKTLETAERRRARAEAVARRKATEIAYLGRGVSNFLDDHRSDLSALEAAGLPPLSNPGELAEVLGLTVSRLRWLAFHAEAATRVHYVTFEVPKKSGGTRTLKAPHRSLASSQRWILDRIVARLPVEAEAHGFVPGRSILTNAQGHAGRKVVVNMDLEDFFPSVGYRRVRAVFRRAGYSPSVATVLGLLCTECPRRTVVYDGTTYHVATAPRGLPQGACTSPGLSNRVARRLDRRLAGLATRFGATYTRYADDLTFSGDDPLEAKVGYLMARVRHLARAEGFRVNEAKTRVLRRNAAQMVTGLVVNDRPGVPRDEIRRLRAILHRAGREGLDAQNRSDRPDFRAWLRGKIAYVSMSRPEVGGRLLAEFLALEAQGGGS